MHEDGKRLLNQDTVRSPQKCKTFRYCQNSYFSVADNTVTSAPTLKIEVVLVTKLSPKFWGKPEIPTRPHRGVACGVPAEAQIGSHLLGRDRLRPERVRSRGEEKLMSFLDLRLFQKNLERSWEAFPISGRGRLYSSLQPSD